MNRKKSKFDSQTFKKLMKFMWETNKVYFSLIIFGMLVTAATFSLSQSFLGIVLFNKFLVPYFISGAKKFDWYGFTIAIILLGLMYLIGVTCQFVASRLSISLAHSTIQKLRVSLYSKMQKLPIKYFDTNLNGNLISIYTNDIDTLREMISQSFPQIINSIATIFILLFLMFYYSWFMTLIVLLLVFVLMFFSSKFAIYSGKYFVQRQKSLGKLNGFISEMINGVKVIKVFNHEQKSVSDLTVKNDEFYKSDFKSKAIMNILFPLFMNMGNINYAIVALIGGVILANNGHVGSLNIGLNIGVLVSFLQYTRSFSNPIATISQQFNTISVAIAGAQRVFAVFEEKEEQDLGTIEIVSERDLNETEKELLAALNLEKSNFYYKMFVDGKVTFKQAKGQVVFKNVYFGYTDQKMILKDINLEVMPGQKIAFVGATGAGKTTITNLINRFYDVNKGEILLDGINLEEIKKSSLRKSLGFVLQDTSLFSKSVKENISYGVENALKEDVEYAANVANADRFIGLMENGFETELENAGENISQGQKQLLSIARTSMLQPMILVLDEATSTIDTETEKHVQEAMYNLMKNRTSFIIAHRLSTIKNVDKIVVLDKGEIAEQGSHKELLAQKGMYYKLYTGAIELD